MTGEAHDWVGHKESDLIAAIGPPTRTIHQSDYSNNDTAIAKLFEGKPAGEIEFLEYIETGDAMAPKESNTLFGMRGSSGGTGGLFGAHGGVSTTETPAHQSTYVNLTRFEVKNGVIVKWFQSRSVDGVVQWTRH